MLVPIVLGLIAVVGGGAAYELLKKPATPAPPGPSPQPQPQPQGQLVNMVAPPGATQNVVYQQPPSTVPAAAPGLTAAQINQQLAALNPASAAAAAEILAGERATVQPQPTVGPAAKQPPLPPVPASGIQSTQAIVNTNGNPGQDSNLRIRTAPSTNGPVANGGEPSQGGGIPKGTVIQVTGVTVSDMTPIVWNGISGWVYSGYLKAV